MGWGNIGLSWTRYAKARPIRHCERCHLDYPEAKAGCPHCSDLEEHELQNFLLELAAKKKKSASLFIIFIAVLLLYAGIVLFVLPAYMN